MLPKLKFKHARDLAANVWRQLKYRPIFVNCMPLPQKLTEVLNSGEWEQRALLSRLPRIFPAKYISGPQLYSFPVIQAESKTWLRDDLSLIGNRIDKSSAAAGTIDPQKAVIIGDLQPETFIVLDYRISLNNPSVLFQDLAGYWHVAAGSFDEFWQRLTSN